MELKLDGYLDKITDFIQNESNTETVIGKEFKLGAFNVVPVIRIGTGFGTGGGDRGDKKSKGELGGAGAGIGIEPIGFLVSKGDEISFIETHHSKGLAAAFEQVPSLVEKYIESQNGMKKVAEPA